MGAMQLGRLARSPSSGVPASVVVDDIEISTNSRDRGRPSRPGARAGGTDAPAGDRIRAALDAIAVYVPAEALGFYVAASAFIGAPTFGQDVFVFTVTIVIVGVLVVLAQQQGPGPERSARRLGLALLFAIVGAALYMSAMPYSFAHRWSPYTPTMSGVVILAAAILMPAIGAILGLTAGGKGDDGRHI
ncbi:hypothetical protein AB0I34_06455 [Kribbella sp. NPDC050281]|uniref:hypothetical protein n=1 Tax=Kribbella sp. NPDC050281 TaxID=3155515 RepID=UPI00340F4143